MHHIRLCKIALLVWNVLAHRNKTDCGRPRGADFAGDRTQKERASLMGTLKQPGHMTWLFLFFVAFDLDTDNNIVYIFAYFCIILPRVISGPVAESECNGSMEVFRAETEHLVKFFRIETSHSMIVYLDV